MSSRLPAVHRVLQEAVLRNLQGKVPHYLVVGAVREVLANYRRGSEIQPSVQEVAVAAQQAIERLLAPSLTAVINATGVIIHTNLGRAPLSNEAVEAVRRVADGYCNLEFDVRVGSRGQRHSHVEELLCRLTGAEAAMVVNNNAAAILLVLSELARGREVIISRGQLVEIGGGFRIPEVMAQSGARLVEVGTTNRTYLRDYEKAIGPDTAALMRVHSSNFKVLGFTHSVSLKELADLAHSRGLLLIDDLGSGALIPTEQFGLEHEPMPQESVRDGADVVCFSGDKLLGGPQAGIVLGRQSLVQRLSSAPLARALRVDKMTLAALEATLRHYLKEEAIAALPVWAAISEPLDSVRARAQTVASQLQAAGIAADVVATEATVGGGSLPGEVLPSYGVAVDPSPWSAAKLAELLRLAHPPVISRIESEKVVLDMRTVVRGQEAVLAEKVTGCFGATKASII
jgi:L-seryl-tRNA(Ser) seleniumtransferase